MARGGSTSAGAVRKKPRANNMGLQWWRKLTLPRRGKKASLLTPTPPPLPLLARLKTRTAALMKAVGTPRVTRRKHLATASWDASRSLACVTCPRGSALQTMGEFIDGAHWLYPEEALYLVDRGALDLCVGGVPVSVQRAWTTAMCAGNAVSLGEYLVYAHLRRAGYVVRRYQGEEKRRLVWSAWRVGSFRRKEEVRALFHVAVAGYEEAVWGVRGVGGWEGKTRVKVALIERGVVVLMDVARNATPLSERYVRRLRGGEGRAREVERGEVAGFIGSPVEEKGGIGEIRNGDEVE